jgi:hypothetical protein
MRYHYVNAAQDFGDDCVRRPFAPQFHDAIFERQQPLKLRRRFWRKISDGGCELVLRQFGVTLSRLRGKLLAFARGRACHLSMRWSKAYSSQQSVPVWEHNFPRNAVREMGANKQVGIPARAYTI